MAERVSICLPAYNHGAYLGAAIESALSQTWTDLEVVVSDNCSTDDTRQVVEAYAKRDARVRYSLGGRLGRCPVAGRQRYAAGVLAAGPHGVCTSHLATSVGPQARRTSGGTDMTHPFPG